MISAKENERNNTIRWAHSDVAHPHRTWYIIFHVRCAPCCWAPSIHGHCNSRSNQFGERIDTAMFPIVLHAIISKRSLSFSHPSIDLACEYIHFKWKCLLSALRAPARTKHCNFFVLQNIFKQTKWIYNFRLHLTSLVPRFCTWKMCECDWWALRSSYNVLETQQYHTNELSKTEKKRRNESVVLQSEM